MEHYGARRVTFRTEGDVGVKGMEFQVSDVKKPLAAVWRIAGQGNIVQFGPREEDNFIRSIETGEKVWMKRKGGSYVMNVDFVKRPVF